MIYRKELDGIRAIAIFAVLFYHANISIKGYILCQGGFFGVDIFFVLSGYLITSIIEYKIDSGKFSYLDFYWSRFKRIVPALLFILIFSTVGAYFILLKGPLSQYINSYESALLFISNIFFYKEDSYTAEASALKPLLHTWTLAIEWQFYLVFPLVYAIIKHFFNRYLFGVLFLLTLLLFGLSIFITSLDDSFSFYMLPTRAWEFTAGSLIALIHLKTSLEQEIKNKRFITEAITLIALFGITYSFLSINHHTAHPSWITLLPVISTAILILATQSQCIVNNILTTKLLGFLGLISYSMYLWHQPVFALYRSFSLKSITGLKLLLFTLIIILLSYITVHFVENPLRKKLLSKRGILLLALMISINLGFVIYYEFNKENLNRPFISEALEEASGIQDLILDKKSCINRPINQACSYDAGTEKNIILVGDSHASRLGRPLYQYAKENGFNFRQYTAPGCIGFLTKFTEFYSSKENTQYRKEIKKCSKFSMDIDNEISNSKPSTIIYFVRMNLYTGFKYKNINIKKKIIKNEILKINLLFSKWGKLGHKIVIVYPAIEFYTHIPKLIQNNISNTLNKAQAINNLDLITTRKIQLEISKQAYDILNSIDGKFISRVYPLDLFCPEEKNKCNIIENGKIYFTDTNHLSLFGSKKVVDEIINTIKNEQLKN